ncbi:hypothetical protein Zmor_026141 [Zophobas morio]|uniref:Secreted protein n=1 Tax=Zophobas morio TaxID=2755281 RepID=A0AA38M4A9_9CUCU|nr:hypothetical protein Zmor_026141 [Zophobas morio]
MLKLIFPLLTTLSSLLICRTTTYNECGEEHFYYDKNDIETLKCALEYLENSQNYTNTSTNEAEKSPASPAVSELTITRDKVIHPMYEESFTEILCKKCSIQLSDAKLAMTIKCFQCLDAESNTQTTATEFRKVLIY